MGRKGSVDERNFDEWVASATDEAVLRNTNCTTCKSPYRDTLRTLLEAIIRHKAHAITRRQIYGKLKQECPDYPVQFRAFEVHLDNHETNLYKRAKGRDQA